MPFLDDVDSPEVLLEWQRPTVWPSAGRSRERNVQLASDEPSNLARANADHNFPAAPRLSHTAIARRPRSCGLSRTTETKAGNFSANVVPLADGTRVSVPPLRSASSRAIVRP